MKRSTTLTFLLLSLLVLVVLAGPAAPVARAASYVVTNTNNSGSGSLREAIETANANTGPDTITFDDSVSGTILLASTLPTINDPAGLTIDGAGKITISGGNQVRVMSVVAAELTLENLTVANGSSGDDGGGIFNFGTLTVSNSTFSGNSASFSNGGAIYNEGTLTISNSTFSENSGGDGGGIFNYLGTATVSDSTFSENSASSGGGIANDLFGGLTVSNSTFSGNSASSGGGIFNDNDGTLRVSNSTFSGNSANVGGAVFNRGGSLTVSNSTFSSNSTNDGGGIANTSSAIVSNSTFSGNSADFDGGGIANGTDATLTVSNSTFSGNSASSGGGINNSGSATLKNTIVANSTGGNCSGAIVNGGGNLSDDTTCPGINADPLLGPLQDNGGPTQTMALLAGSPAIDAANDAVCVAAPVNNRDQRGVTRPQGAHCDIGAFELEQASNSPPAVAADSGAVTVDEGMTATNSGTVSDPDDDSVTLAASLGTVTNNGNGTWSWSFSTSDGPSESQTVTISADDGNGGTAETTFDLVVNNIAPTVDSITVPVDPVSINSQPVSASASFSDPAGVADESYTCTVDYDDGSGPLPGTVSGFTCTGPDHTYAIPGVYQVTVTVTDKDGDSGSATAVDYLIIYDPSDGFVTGGGWIDSPADACPPGSICEGATGKATFGFVSKYKKGASTPTGNTEFQFQAGGLHFYSDTYEWLVINQGGTNAQFKGEGAINGSLDSNGNAYKFMLWASDGSPDTFRIKIWWEDGDSEIVVYDNGFDQPIGGGSIVVHKGK